MSIYLKTRLYEDPFMVRQNLIKPSGINRLLKFEPALIYDPITGFTDTESPNCHLKIQMSESEKSLACELSLHHSNDSVRTIIILPFELFIMRSHSQSTKFADLHLFIEDLQAEDADCAKAYLSRFLEHLRRFYNGNWVIADQELHASRLF